MNRVNAYLIIPSIVLTCASCSKAPSTSSTPAAAPAATASAPSTQAPVDVSISEYSIVLSSNALHAGPTTFSVKNTGTRAHEFVVLKTDTAAAALPVGSFEGESDRIDEDAAGTNVGETGDMEPGTTKTLTITLEPGHYAVVCNLPGHYRMGMHQDVTVSP